MGLKSGRVAGLGPNGCNRPGLGRRTGSWRRGWSGGQTSEQAQPAKAGKQGLFEGRLRRSKALPTHGRSYERCTSVARAFTRDRAKKFSRQDRRRALVKGSNRYSLWRGDEWASGRAVAGVEGVANTRTLVRAMYERYTSVYERSGKKILRGSDRRAEAGRGAWLWGSTKRQRKGIQSIGLRSGRCARGAGDGWHGRSGGARQVESMAAGQAQG